MGPLLRPWVEPEDMTRGVCVCVQCVCAKVVGNFFCMNLVVHLYLNVSCLIFLVGHLR